MKKLFTFIIITILAGSASAQVFWTETFGTTCNFRGHANGFVSSNGTWAVNSTGTNAANANEFFINDRISYKGTGVCAGGSDLACGSPVNNSLHVGGSAFGLISIPEDSASYWTGFYCSFFGFCSTTNKRAESPAINCSGKTGVNLSFVYYEGGDTGDGLPNGDATLWYYDGSSWAQISTMAKTPRNCSGTMYGVFTDFTIALPSSADNNPNVKIGFNWTSDDVSHGTDPSFAVDSIRLSGGGSVVLPPVAKITYLGDTASCAPLCIGISDNSTNSPTSWKWTFNGANPPSSTLQNPGAVCWPNAGTYSIKLVVSNSGGTDSVTLTNYLHVQAAPPTPIITQGHDTLYCSYDPSYTSYQWYDSTTAIPGGTHSYYKVTHAGQYNVGVAI
jgi:hypothetical protein